MKYDYELVSYCEFDKYASKAYSIMHDVSEDLNLGDINNVNEKEVPDFDVMTYGFPCQSFSSIGSRLGFLDKEKGNLFFESMRIAKEKQPKIMIAENVKGLLTQDKGNAFKTILEVLDEVGYNSYWTILNSVNFDVPQTRERVFIVSIRKDVDNKKFEFPKGELTKKVIKDIIEDVDRKTPKESLRPYFDEKYFLTNYKSAVNLKKLFDGVKQGYTKTSFLANRIFSIDGVSPTITTHNDIVFYEIYGHLTCRERFKLQGFNPDYVDLLLSKGISKCQIDKMSGNSITVPVVENIFKKIFEANIL